MTESLQCGLVLLAAGASTRMGRPKQLLEIDRVPLVRRAALAALASSARPIVVVLGANAALIRPQLADLFVLLVENSRWPEGMGSSLRCGMQAMLSAAPALDSVIVALADQPQFSGVIIEQLRARQRETGNSIVSSSVAAQVGPPALFLCRHFPELLACCGDTGARALIRANARNLASVDLGEQPDLDTPTDYRSYLKKQKTGPAPGQ